MLMCVWCAGEMASGQSVLDNDTDHYTDHVHTDAMLDYCERFNELLDNKEYHMAAMHAANSPQGILRTTETVERFAGKTNHAMRTIN